ncbi:HIT family protein [Halopelagius longus]|uniref:ATP adenylyltransferase n=1 Tax=Halopelagius longus TaxID=1236180 RepID=A0A1H0YII0_9EURY|nr:HIT domain-containing protein [Halopelagius longus]RDI72505.1 HIT domain-containing protein [Halopelagius longus]SDQ14830.1 ATP adenylyltransferase [Halopelagius longus]
MEQLFAPWRIEWVERDDDEDSEGCPFCVLPERDDDRESRVVARSDHAFVILNNYPYNPGHAMVIPYRHTGEWGDLTDAELLDHAKLKAATLEAFDAAIGPDAANVGENLGGGASGGSIDDHLHTHVVPRWNGDTNFMPVVGDTKVLVEALDDTYDRLHEAFAGLDAADGGDGATEEGDATADAAPDAAVRLSFETAAE